MKMTKNDADLSMNMVSMLYDCMNKHFHDCWLAKRHILHPIVYSLANIGKIKSKVAFQMVGNAQACTDNNLMHDYLDRKAPM